MSDVDNVFVGADAVEGRHVEARNRTVPDLESPAGVCKPDDGSLRPRPFQDRQIPRGPVPDAMGLRVVLIFQSEQHQVPRVAGRKPRYLEVVVHPAIGLRERVVLAGEKLLLVVITGPPREHRADIERLAAQIDGVLGFHRRQRLGEVVRIEAREAGFVAARIIEQVEAPAAGLKSPPRL